MKRILSSLVLLFFTASLHAFTILIDPGHGGEDKGATGKQIYTQKGRSYYEKDIALLVSKVLYRELQKFGYDVYMTRSLDRNVSLDERAQLAEKIKADLFISVHLNSSQDHSSHGVELFYLDNSRDAAVRKVEKVENTNLNGEEQLVHQILTDLVIERTVQDSKELCQAVHVSLKNSILTKYNMTDRGVKAGLFYVLALSKRPGLLLELGFISNPKELKKLLSVDLQDHYAKAIALGVDRFIKQKKKK